ncbi:MCAK-like kinesin, putative [Trypanosoma cruzi marinkellei]|uniref:MCAK-like kinesin, putative n=1 Tax=Trypanosoma cruzi marinkellei TaxID=85056 RepID=K2NVL2_TRYCR|nr:MCAK-like kinesin, putative [Trypanosoma cruzi marinkellei]
MFSTPERKGRGGNVTRPSRKSPRIHRQPPSSSSSSSQLKGKGEQQKRSSSSERSPHITPHRNGHDSTTPTVFSRTGILKRSPPLHWESPAPSRSPISSRSIYFNDQRRGVTSGTNTTGGLNKCNLHMNRAGSPNGTTVSRSLYEVSPFLATINSDNLAVSKNVVSPSSRLVEPGSVSVVVRIRPQFSRKTTQPCCRVIGVPGVVEYTMSVKESSGVGNGVQMSSSSAVVNRQPATGATSQEPRKILFSFDATLGETAGQADTMACVGTKMLQYLLNGYNATILCYGQSGSGKTHSMLGPAGGIPDRIQKREDFGLVPRMLEQLFTRLQEKFPREQEGGEKPSYVIHPNVAGTDGENNGMMKSFWQLEIGVLELYQEELRDLMADSPPLFSPSRAESFISVSNGVVTGRTSFVPEFDDENGFDAPDIMEAVDKSPSVSRSFPTFTSRVRSMRSVPPTARDLKIREDPDWGVVVSGLSWHPVNSFEEAMPVLLRAERMRRVESTALNERSSRSHLFVFLALQQWGVMETTQSGEHSTAVVSNRTRSLLTLVDLAGSERVSATGAEGLRLKEAQNINLSLSLLGNVIRKLTAKERERGQFAHIPYRDSKLTRLLQESIGGNAFTTLLCTVSPDISDAAESLSTLQFAQRAKGLRNRPVVNHTETKEDLKSRLNVAQSRITWLENQLAILMNKPTDHQSLMERVEENVNARGNSDLDICKMNGNPADPASMKPVCIVHPPIFYDIPGETEESDFTLQYIPGTDMAQILRDELYRREEEYSRVQNELDMYTRLLREEREEHERMHACFLEERRRRLEMENKLRRLAPSQYTFAFGRDDMDVGNNSDDHDRVDTSSRDRLHRNSERETHYRTLWRHQVTDSPWRRPRLGSEGLHKMLNFMPFMSQHSGHAVESGSSIALPGGESKSPSFVHTPPDISLTCYSPRTLEKNDDDDDEQEEGRSEVAGTFQDSPHTIMMDSSSIVGMLMQYGVDDMIQS